jgi:uncharacterized protein
VAESTWSGGLVWAALQFPGLEHVLTRADEAGFRADAQLVLAEERPCRVRYLIECDPAWRFTALTMTISDAGGDRTLKLTATPDGQWQSDGEPRPDLDGCVDIDINCTPLTNTLPIRRLGWATGTAHDLSVAYVSVPDLTVRPVSQRYTRLAPDVYQYESGTFRTELPVDEGGFVLDYPVYWSRVWPAAVAGSG